MMNELSYLSATKGKLIVIMGVSGSGKSTLAIHVAHLLNYHFVEADSFHTGIAKSMMSESKPITDKMRQAWVNRLCMYLNGLLSEGKNIVLAYSGLKAVHRNQVRHLTMKTCFILLSGAPSIIAERINKRTNHFVTASFLQSQIDAMEQPEEGESDITIIDIDKGFHFVVDEALNTIQLKHSTENS